MFLMHIFCLNKQIRRCRLTQIIIRLLTFQTSKSTQSLNGKAATYFLFPRPPSILGELLRNFVSLTICSSKAIPCSNDDVDAFCDVVCSLQAIYSLGFLVPWAVFSPLKQRESVRKLQFFVPASETVSAMIQTGKFHICRKQTIPLFLNLGCCHY